MANEEHKQLLLQGVNQWNTWRMENHDLRLTPNLSNIDLVNVNLIGANFAFTDLSGANLAFANLSGVNFVQANLTQANLHRATLVDADLSGACLSDARLTEVIFVETHLRDTDFMNAVMARTVLVNLDLRGCKNLNTIRHTKPSSLSIDTIMKSKGIIPIEFLRGVGLKESLITFLSSLDYSSTKPKSTGKKYYTDHINPEGETIYTIMDTAKPVGQMLRRTTEAPQGDGKTTEPYYLDAASFWDMEEELNQEE